MPSTLEMLSESMVLMGNDECVVGENVVTKDMVSKALVFVVANGVGQ